MVGGTLTRARRVKLRGRSGKGRNRRRRLPRRRRREVGPIRSRTTIRTTTKTPATMVKLGTATGRDGVVYSGSKSDLKLMEELARDNHRGSTFGGRVGKLERIARFEAEQLAKHGVQNGSRRRPSSSKPGREDEEKKKDEKKDKKKKKKKKKKKTSGGDDDERDGETGEKSATLTAEEYEGEQSASTKKSRLVESRRFRLGRRGRIETRKGSER